jgi:hypothetical protein
MTTVRAFIALGLVALGLVACTGAVSAPGIGAGDTYVPDDIDAVQAIGATGLRRLSVYEYDLTVADLVFDTGRPGASRLPEDVSDPFDNDFANQQVSKPLVESAELLAEEIVTRLLADTERRDRVVGCAPSGPDDAECLRGFIASFGRRALRRELSSDEIEELSALASYSREADDFYFGVGLVLRALFQDAEFLYRVELGRPVEGVPNVFKLDDYEVATRLSYFVWGTTPDDALLDRARDGALATPEAVVTEARRLLADPRARDRVDRFHAMWLGYRQLPHEPMLVASMRAESRALVDRVIFDEHRPYTDLFTLDETFADARLGELYGIDAPSSGADWVSWDESGRRGLLSTGSFLSVASKFDDTSPTQRGILVRARLLCQPIMPAPATVNTDNPPQDPGGSECKSDRYAAHAAGGCATCHSLLDPVGFGLENYDNTGRFRAHDDGAPECAIEGRGEVLGVGEFSGPAELGELLVESRSIDACAVTQLFRFAMGRRETVEDAAVLESLTENFRAGGYAFDELVLKIVGSPTFGFRRVPETSHCGS